MTAADMTTISHERAREAAQRIINSAFRNGGDGMRASIPAQPDQDDDLVLCAYIEQQSSASKAALPEEVAEVVDYLQGDVDGAVMTPERRAILAKAVTLLSALASRAQTAEAVAAKSREEALETLRAIADSNPEAYDECCGSGVQTSYDEPPECCAQPIRDNAGRAKAREAIFALALKSSRTDSGKAPATNSVESGRATEDDGATKNV